MNSKTLIQKPFYFIRHGQTDWNAKGLIMGQIDIPLDQTGMQQARQLQGLLSKHSFTHVFHSPLQRVLQTMQIATEQLSCLKAPLEELKEWHLGEWEGKPKHQNIMDNIYVYPPGGESWQQFFERTLIGINYALSHDGQPVLIFAHNPTFWALCYYIGLESEPIKNCQVVYFEPPSEKKRTWSITYLE